MSTATLPLATPRSLVAPTVSERLQLAFAAFAGLCTAALRGVHHQAHLGTLLMDPYWVNFYLTGYQDGFRRRALVGTVIRLISPHVADVRLLNALAVVTVCALIGLLLMTFFEVADCASQLAALFAFALFASAMLSVDFEVLGDTLQLALVIFLTVALIARRWREHAVLHNMLVFGALGLAFLIHEASIFFLAPCIPFVRHRSPNLRHFLPPAIAALTLFAVSAHWSAVNAHLTYAVLLYPHTMPALSEPVGTPSFGALMHTEYIWDFGTRGNMLRFVERCLSVSLMVCAALIALAHSVTRHALERMLHVLAILCVFSAPLWIIAHDWGRFMAYNLLLAVTLSIWQPDATAPRRIAQMAVKLIRLSRYQSIQLATILLLIASPFVHNRDLVLAPAVFESCISMLGLALIANVLRRVSGARSFANAGASL